MIRYDSDPARMGFPVSTRKQWRLTKTIRHYPQRSERHFWDVWRGLASADVLDDIAQRREGRGSHLIPDIFSHRITTQYYRIWRKYAYPATFEAGGRDATSQCLLGLVGLGILHGGTGGNAGFPFSGPAGHHAITHPYAEGIRAR